jgi:tripartite-type tricarboxylate transporter receptor subunit TctC
VSLHCRILPAAWRVLALALVLACVATVPARADDDAVARFYKGRNIQLYIGYSAGGGYDIYARVLARHLGRHIPGNPTIVPQNMPGAGSLRLANYLYNVAPKDGTAFATFARGMATEPLLGGTGTQFDGRKFSWIGSVTDEVSVCAFWNTSGIATWQDMLTKSYTVGGTGSASDTDVFPNAIKRIFDLKMKLVTGFPGGSDVVLALQRGEVNGRCGWSWSSLLSRNKQMYDDKQINIPVQLALHKHEDLPDVPVIVELTKDPKQLAALRLIFARQTMARPYVAPPGIPEERKAALRKAFDETMKDPQFVEEAKRTDLEIHPVSGAEIDTLLAELYATPPDVVKLAIDAIGAR